MSEITLRLAQRLRAGDAELGLGVEHVARAGKFIAREISRARLLGRLGDDVTLAEEFGAGRSPETAR